MKSDVLQLISGNAAITSNTTGRSRPSMRGRGRLSNRIASIDELAMVAREMLNDPHLEVSKVRPFFWMLVETYADRFRAYPFDTFKALYGYLEMRDFPKEEMEYMITMLEQAYEEHHGEMQKQEPTQLRRFESVDEEIEHLRHSLCYASLVDRDKNSD